MSAATCEQRECLYCGGVWTRDEYEAECVADAMLDDMMADRSPEWCPDCVDAGFVVEVGSAEWKWQKSIIASVRRERRIAKAYPSLYDGDMYVKDMREAGRGHLVREVR